MSLLGPSLQRAGAARPPSITRRAQPEWQRLQSRHDTRHTRRGGSGTHDGLRRWPPHTGKSTAFQHLPNENYPFPSLACSEIIKSTGLYSPKRFSGRKFQDQDLLPHLTAIKTHLWSNTREPRARAWTLGPRTKAAAARSPPADVPESARSSPPSRAGPRGPRATGPASAARGAARDGRGRWAAKPTWAGAGTCGRDGARPGGGPPRPLPGRRLHLTCGLSSSVSSMGSLSIPGIVAEGGRRQETRRPACSSWPGPALSRRRCRRRHPCRPNQAPSGPAGNPAPSPSLPRLPARPLARGDARQRGGAGREVTVASAGLGGGGGGAAFAQLAPTVWARVGR